MQSTTQGVNEPDDSPSQMALGGCLVDGDPETRSRARRRRQKTFGVSLAIEILLLVVLVGAPLLSSVAQPQLRQLLPTQLTFLGRISHDPIQRVTPPTTMQRPETPNPFPQLALPSFPVRIRHDQEPGIDPMQDFADGYIPGVFSSAEIGRTPPPVEPPRAEHPAQLEKHVLKVSEGILEAQLIARVEPQYPAIAIQTRTEGTVRLHAIIGRDGSITSLDVLSGHPFLVKAALDAVRQWHYRPTMLNGAPVEVETSITVIFRLRG